MRITNRREVGKAGAKRRSVGVTLLEVIVTVSIITLLSTISVVGSMSVLRHSLVKSSAEEVGAFLREAASYALNGVKDSTCDLTVATNVPLCSQYEVRFTSGSGTFTRKAKGTGSTTLSQTLRGGVVVGTTVNPLLFKYAPPELVVEPAPTTVVVRHAGGSPSWNVCVSRLGRIEVKPSSASC